MLLRFLETGEGRPVGSTRTIRADVRLIAATHRGLDRGGGTGTLRLDLYYRLRRVLLELPPLRERPEDIPLLVEHYRRVINARHQRLGMAVEGVRPRAMAALQAYDWPGNVRELAAVLEQAMIFQRSGWLQPEDFELLALSRRADGPSAPSEGDVPDWGARALTDLERLGSCQQEVLRIVRARGQVRRADVMARCQVSREFARQALTGLVDRRLLRREGVGRGARYVLVAGGGEEAAAVSVPHEVT